MTGCLENRSALITGASRGLGRAIAEAYMKEGADLLLCARKKDRLDATAAELRSLTGAKRRIETFAADLGQAEDVDRLADYAFRCFPSLDILVSNAGIYGPKGPLESVDWNDFVKTLTVNVLGSARLYRAVLPAFKSRGSGKIIQLSGGGATNPLPFLSAYALSKAAIVRLVETVAEETRGSGIDVNAIAPGALNTGMLEEILAAGPDAVGEAFYQRALRQKQEGGTPLSRGADLAVYLASAASNGLTGKLISAVWDPWEQFDRHRQDLDQTDLLTLRRIVPSDRGWNWDRTDARGVS
ncbi:MAG: SDR family oxidoreductase [Kiritimatiellia bacterium]|nr:SDR family oxidoreductase [Kiritimatiellia bacterium]